MYVAKLVAAAIAERLYDDDLSKVEYLEQCRVAGKQVNGMPPAIIKEAAEFRWNQH